MRFLVLSITLFPFSFSSLFACAVCVAGNESTRMTYYWATWVMALLPMSLIGVMSWFLYKFFTNDKEIVIQ